jgi:ribosomal protein L37AE/L43A
MVSYTFTNYNGGKLLIPKNAMLTEEYLMDHGRLFMTEIPVKDDWGRTYRRYRLKSGEAMRFSNTLEYDIECPNCHDKMRICDLPMDRHTHGLYKCRRCDEKVEKGGRQ